VELDDFLDGIPVQYREVQGSESSKFLHYFDHFMVQHGGIESGFHHVEIADYRKRLLHVKGTTRNVVVREVAAHTSSLNKGDVFILDLGLKLIQFVGPKAGVGEKGKATQLCRALDDERGSKVEIVGITLDDKDDNAKQFWDFLGGRADIAESGGDDAAAAASGKKRLFRVHEEGGKVAFTEVACAKASLDSGDVFIFDALNEIFVWCGNGSTKEEKKQGFIRAQEYLNQQKDRSKSLPIVRVMQGGENEEFHASF